MTTGTIATPVAAGAGEYVLRMRGDSMRDAGMLDGDHLVVKEADTAMDGEIVVALIGQEATVKRWFVEPDGSIRLEPANPDYEPIRTTDAKVIGRVVGMFREYQGDPA